MWVAVSACTSACMHVVRLPWQTSGGWPQQKAKAHNCLHSCLCRRDRGRRHACSHLRRPLPRRRRGLRRAATRLTSRLYQMRLPPSAAWGCARRATLHLTLSAACRRARRPAPLLPLISGAHLAMHATSSSTTVPAAVHLRPGACLFVRCMIQCISRAAGESLRSSTATCWSRAEIRHWCCDDAVHARRRG
jgi:hypothetical protein